MLSTTIDSTTLTRQEKWDNHTKVSTTVGQGQGHENESKVNDPTNDRQKWWINDEENRIQVAGIRNSAKALGKKKTFFKKSIFKQIQQIKTNLFQKKFISKRNTN